MLMTSALKRKAASSNEVRVRVLGSRKKFTSVFPRSAGTFLISRVPTCLKASAVSSRRFISSADNSRSPRRSLRFERALISIRSRATPLLHRYLDESETNLDPFDRSDCLSYSPRNFIPAGRNSRQHHLSELRSSLDYFMRNAP